MEINIVDMDYLLDELEQNTSGLGKICFDHDHIQQPQSQNADVTDHILYNKNEKNISAQHNITTDHNTILYQEIEEMSNRINGEDSDAGTTITSIIGKNTENENTAEQQPHSTEVGQGSMLIIRNDIGLSNSVESMIADNDFSSRKKYVEVYDVNESSIGDEIIENNTHAVHDDCNSNKESYSKENNAANCEQIERNIETLNDEDVTTDFVFISNNFYALESDVVIKIPSITQPVVEDVCAISVDNNNSIRLLQKSKEFCNGFSKMKPNKAVCNETQQSCSSKDHVSTGENIASSTVDNECPGTITKSVVESTHDISVFNSEFKLTESELLLGKVKPYWIPDEDCSNCMLCSNKFTLVNRRHHCRSCGRVLCGACCQIRRILPYMMAEADQRKQRICAPCNKTMDRIEIYNKFVNDTGNRNNLNTSSGAPPSDENDPIMVNDSLQPSSSKMLPQRKKSVLKVRTSTIDSTNEEANFPALCSPHSVPFENSQSIILMSNEGEYSDTQNSDSHPTIKRNVTFRDGVNPGDDYPSGDILKNEINGASSTNNFRKSSKRLSRKMMEKRADEENVKLLGRCSHVFCVKNCESELLSADIGNVWEQIVSGNSVSIAIRRNVYAVIQITELATQYDTTLKKVLSISTRGFNSVGADELVIIIECGENTFDVGSVNEVTCDVNKPENILAEEGYIKKECDDNNVTRPKHIVNEMNHTHLLDMLTFIERIFSSCISTSPYTAATELDDRLGIRRCSRRMQKFYEITSGSLAGIEASAICLCRPYGHLFGNILVSNTPFFVGILFKKSEILWGNCLPNRILFALGKQSSCYPTSIINAKVREPIFSIESTNHSVLKVLNDFRKFSYQIAKIDGSYVSLLDSETNVVIPIWAQDQLKIMIETNQNMFGWALDFNAHADSQLTCFEQKLNDDGGDDEITFKTHIFSKVGAVRKATGSTFIIFDGALRVMDQSTGASFAVSVVEDGVIIRMSSNMMTELVKHLLSGKDFELRSTKMHLRIQFVEDPFKLNYSQDQEHSVGRLISPIDETNIMGKYQYGLVNGRALRSLCHFASCSEWALRLGAVINFDAGGFGKFPARLQSKYFEICEQLTVYICFTLDPYVGALIYANQKEIYFRVRVNEENATYETAKWANLEDQHYLWTLALDEQIIPFLYGLCPLVSLANAGSASGLHVELQMQIVSIRPLNFCCITSSSRAPKSPTTLS